MYQHKKAFTLIELLVVVLIMGILASVAVPQYQRAVQKAQFTKLRVLADSIGKTVWSYYLGNGDWPKSFDELDVSLPSDMSTKTHPQSGSTCASNSEMYCCIARPLKDYSSGFVMCGKPDASLVSWYSFVSKELHSRQAHMCCEFATNSFCRTLLGAVKFQSRVITPEGWKDLAQGGGCYRID